jgi:hypothetical protein
MVITDSQHPQSRRVIKGKNLVVTLGREAMAKLLGGARAGAVTQFGVGTGSTTAALGDTTLTSVFRNALVSVSYPALNQVRFNWQLGAGEAVGLAIREFGLFFADNTMLSRYVETGVITKSATMTITGTWTLTF